MEASHPPELTEGKLPHPGALDPAGSLSPSRWLCTAGVPCPQALQALPARHSPGWALGGQRGNFIPCLCVRLYQIAAGCLVTSSTRVFFLPE